MQNMSYCRFQNTLLALRECTDAIEGLEPLSRDEHYSMKKLVEVCYSIVAAAEEGDLPKAE